MTGSPLVYQPESLVLGTDDPKRRFFSNKIEEEEMNAYDFKTFLFDLFHIEGDKEYKAIGPALLNFTKEPGRPAVYSETKLSVRVNKTVLSRLAEWTFTPASISTQSLSFKFRKMESRNLNPNLIKPFPSGSRVLTAIQKNNRIEWILDWFAHYQDHFGVDHLVLYDNGSDNFDELMSKLPGNVILVRWDFPYGPPTSHDNKYAQIGALNHCRITFGRNSTIFNFDIDELLVDISGIIEKRILHDNVLYFSSYYVPHNPEVSEQYSFRDYSLRHSWPQLQARKFIFKANSSNGILPHYVHTKGIPPLSNLIVLLRKVRNTWMLGSNPTQNLRVRLITFLIHLICRWRKEDDIEIDDAYFLHFFGITTNWKRNNRKKDQREPDDVIDPFLIEISRRNETI